MLASRRSFILALAFVGGCGGGSLSQANETQFAAYAATQQPHAQIVYGDAIQPGTQLVVRFDQAGRLDASPHPGQAFNAIVASPLVDPSGRVIVPVGARVIGHVGEAESGSRLHFDQLRVGAIVEPIRARTIATQRTAAASNVTLEIETAIPVAALRGSGPLDWSGALGGGPNQPRR